MLRYQLLSMQEMGNQAAHWKLERKDTKRVGSRQPAAAEVIGSEIGTNVTPIGNLFPTADCRLSYCLLSVYLNIIAKQMRFGLLLAIFFLPVSMLFAQEKLDTVYLMSGKTVEGVVKDTSNDKLKILIPKKDGGYKADFIDQSLVFSVKYKTGTEAVFYKQDTLFGDYYTANEIRYFLQGERDARKHYRCPLWITGGFAFGIAGGLTGSMIGLIAPFGYGIASVPPRVKIRPGSVSNPDYLKYDTYLMGYEKVSRQKRVMRSFASGAAGFVVGIVVRSLYIQYDEQH